MHILDKPRKWAYFLKFLWKICPPQHNEEGILAKECTISMHSPYSNYHRIYYLYSLTSLTELNYINQEAYFVRKSKEIAWPQAPVWKCTAFSFQIFQTNWCTFLCLKYISTLLSSLRRWQLKENYFDLPVQTFSTAFIPANIWAAFI